MKLMVIDTQGPGGISDAYRALLPGVHIRGIELGETTGQPCTPHGAWCGYLAALPLAANGIAAELIFVRSFDRRDRWVAPDDWLLDVIDREKPDYLTCSWGAWHGGDPANRDYARASFTGFARGIRRVVERSELVYCASSGNNDDNNAQDDVVYPQADLSDICIIVGAAQKNGVPCRWSADGAGVALVMWGDGVASPNAAGTWSRWSGTSASCPKACGAAAALAMTREGFMSMVRAQAERPRDWTGKLPHPKWGYGNGETFWQVQVADAAPAILPPASAGALRITAMDYKRRSK